MFPSPCTSCGKFVDYDTFVALNGVIFCSYQCFEKYNKGRPVRPCNLCHQMLYAEDSRVDERSARTQNHLRSYHFDCFHYKGLEYQG